MDDGVFIHFVVSMATALCGAFVALAGGALVFDIIQYRKARTGMVQKMARNQVITTVIWLVVATAALLALSICIGYAVV